MRKLIALILVTLMVSPGMVFAQLAAENPPVPDVPQAGPEKKTADIPKTSLVPIDVDARTFEYYDADNGWTDATSISYSYKGSLLAEPKDFERVIYPLNDPAANGLLRSAADKDGWGEGLLWGGIALETAGWTDFTVEMLDMGTSTDSPGHMAFHDPNMLPSTLLILGGVGVFLKGLFTQIDAGGDRAQAVDRYNSVLQSNKNLSMLVLPDAKTVGLGITQTF